MVGGQAELSLYVQPFLGLALLSVRSAASLDSRRSAHPAVNCTCKASVFQAPYENLMPDDLKWS